MSKICEKCGSVIPDGADSCPNCSREDYSDEALMDVLSELGIALEEEKTTGSAGGGTDSDLDLSQLDELLGGGDTFLPDLDEELDGDTDADTGPADMSAGEAAPEENAADASSDLTKIFNTAEVQEKAQRSRQTQRAKQSAEPKQKSRQKAQSAQRQEPQEQLRRVQTKRRSDREMAEEKPPKKEMKKRSAAVIGVLIGLVVALLLIAGGVAFMLYQMGFFDTMSDDELLGTTAAATTQQVLPSPSPSPSEAPASLVEEPVEVTEEAEASVLEEPVETEEPAIEVNKFKVTGASTIYLYSRGETAEVVYVIDPSEAASEIEWSSDNEVIATVDANGVIRARRGGNCVITGAIGDIYISVSVVCSFEVPTTVLDMNMEDITMSYEGQTAQLAIDYELTQEQEDATVWESSDESVATVDEEGVVTAVSNGTAVITASIGEYTASCIVRCVGVTGNRGYNSDESEYVINYEDVTLSRKGEYFQLTLTSVLGEEVPSFTWKSDDTDVATVDSKGVVTAVSDGTAYVTATVGGDQFRCIVRVHISD